MLTGLGLNNVLDLGCSGDSLCLEKVEEEEKYCRTTVMSAIRIMVGRGDCREGNIIL